jgi:hypothetical protein
MLKSVPQAGEREVLPERVRMVCPICGGGIKRKQYSGEAAYVLCSALMPTIGFVGYLFLNKSDKTWASASLFVGILLGIFINITANKMMEDWKRYEVDYP